MELTPRMALDSILDQIEQIMRRPHEENTELFEKLAAVKDAIEDGFASYRDAIMKAQKRELEELRKQVGTR